MKKLLNAGLIIAAFCFWASPLMAVEPTATLEEIVVTGKRPGPPLLRVDYEQNTLWVFATLRQLPKSLEWDSSAYRYILDNASVILMPPKMTTSVNNPFKAIKVYRQYNKLRKLPNRQTLDQVIAEPLYQRFLEKKQKYAPKHKKIYRYRPVLVGYELYDAALKQLGLGNERKIVKQVRRLAKKSKTKVVDIKTSVVIDEVIASLKNIDREREHICLIAALDSIDNDILQAQSRAIDWVHGDKSVFNPSGKNNDRQQCFDVIFNSPQAKQAKQDNDNLWLETAFQAITTHEVSFAILPIEEIIYNDGLFNQLKSKLRAQ